MVSKKIIGVLCGILLSCALISSAQNAIAADNAIISSFGEPINYGDVPSPVRDFFPIGTVAIPDLGYSPNILWRWLGSRASGRLQALIQGNHIWRNLQLPVELKGIYTVQFLIPEVRRGTSELWPIGMNVKLAKDKKFDLVSVPQERNFKEWVTWKKVDLTGQTIIIGRPDGFSSAFTGIRFVPEDGGKAITWQGAELLEKAKQSNDVFEDNNPADVAAHMRPVFERLQHLHLNTVVAANVTSAPAQLTVLDMAQQYGLKVILDEKSVYTNIERKVMEFLTDDPNTHPDPEAAAKLVEAQFKPIIDKVKDHPALLAYSVHDEPFVEEAPGYRLVYDTIRRLDPKHPATGYLCRATWNSDEGSRRGVDNMKKFVEAVGAEVLLNDLYPIRNPVSDSAEFIDHYAVCLDDDMRQAGGRPLWIAAQTIRYNKILRDPTPAEIRVQAYLSAAHGATGLLYYNYNGADSSLLDEFGQPTPNLIEVGRVAEELSRLAPVLLTLQRVKITGKFPAYLDVQGFQSKDGAHFVMAVNKDVNAAHSLNLTLPGTNVRQVVDIRSGKVLSLQQHSVNLDLAPGDGMLLQLK